VELSEKRVSASKIIPLVRLIHHKIYEKGQRLKSPTASQLRSNLQRNLREHCGVEPVRILAVLTLLDPRFIDVAFGCSENGKALTSEGCVVI